MKQNADQLFEKIRRMDSDLHGGFSHKEQQPALSVCMYASRKDKQNIDLLSPSQGSS
jgi:hypothetical protein